MITLLLDKFVSLSVDKCLISSCLIAHVPLGEIVWQLLLLGISFITTFDVHIGVDNKFDDTFDVAKRN